MLSLRWIAQGDMFMSNAQSKDTNETRLALLEKTCSHIYESLERMEKTNAHRFDKIDLKLQSLDSRIWANFYWMLGGFASILTVLAKINHWF